MSVDQEERVRELARHAALKMGFARSSVNKKHQRIIAAAIRAALNEYAEKLKSQDVYHELAARAEQIDNLERQLAAAREALERIQLGYCDCPSFVEARKVDDLSIHGPSCPRRIARDALAKTGDKS